MSGIFFDEILHIEESFYREGYDRGVADGARAGQIEGRTLGLENGFSKFVESGRLYGKSVVWANRLRKYDSCRLAPPLPGNNARLRKNIQTVYLLMEPATLSTANTDEAVGDFDNRVKQAQGKARIVEKTVNELATAPAPVGRCTALPLVEEARNPVSASMAESQGETAVKKR